MTMQRSVQVSQNNNICAAEFDVGNECDGGKCQQQ